MSIRQPSAENKPPRKAFKSYPIGFFHIDITEIRAEEGKLYLFIAIDRISKYVMAKLKPQADMASVKRFLEELVDTALYRVHTVFIDNGIQLADSSQNRNEPTAKFRWRPFDRVCWHHGIKHRLTRINHHWQKNPELFYIDPYQPTSGLYTGKRTRSVHIGPPLLPA